MHTLADFLNHGLLPFTGRGAQIDELKLLWRSAATEGALRTVLLTGEAGTGKSRLLDVILPEIARGGGIGIHVKLYPDATVSLVPLLVEAIERSGLAMRLLPEAPEATFTSAVAALRRLARLRPLVLAFEDIHLLRNESVVEFSRLLQTLHDDAITLYAFARPPDPIVRGTLEPYLIREISLQGLTRDEIHTLWCSLFNSPPDDVMIDALLEHTLGNLLALRSALRGAINSGTLAAVGHVWQMTVPPGVFAEALERGVQVLSEGMASHLTGTERSAALMLATLGEVFSREAADHLLDDAEEVIERLIFKGIISLSDTPTNPVSGRRSSSPPLEFTHSLVHRHLVDSATPDIRRLTSAIAAGDPVYASVPFDLIADAEPIELDVEKARSAITVTTDAIRELNVSADWRLCHVLYAAACKLAIALERHYTELERTRLRAFLLQHLLLVDVRIQHSDEFAEKAWKMVELTSIDDEMMWDLHLAALGFVLLSEYRRNPSGIRDIWMRADALIGRHPELRFSRGLIRLLRRAIFALTSSHIDPELLSLIQNRVESLEADPHAPEEFLDAVKAELYPEMLMIYSSKAEFEQRLGYLAELEKSAPQGYFLSKRWWIRFYAGRFAELDRMKAESLESAMRIGEVRSYHFCQILHLNVRLVFGEPFDNILQEAERLYSRIPEEIRPSFTVNLQQYLSAMATLSAGPASGRVAAERFGTGFEMLDLAELALYGIDANDQKLLEEALEQSEPDHPLGDLVRAAIGDQGVKRNDVRKAALAALGHEVYQIFDYLDVVAAIELLRYIEHDSRFAGLEQELSDEIRRSLNEWIRWLCNREAGAIVATTLERYGHHLSQKQLREHRSALARIRRQHTGDDAAEASGQQGLHVSMIGEIDVRNGSEESMRVRGSRLRRFLGILVADRMLDRRLSFREICELLEGDENGTPSDPERLRKALNDAVYRVREVLGPNSIITDRERCELNLDLVRVDLLDAHRAISATAAALNSGSLAPVIPSLTTAFERVNDDVVFPGLYDDFFESARAEFDYRLRATTLGAARALITANDFNGAETILRNALKSMQGDDEIAELLGDALKNQGRFTEATRLRLITNY